MEPRICCEYCQNNDVTQKTNTSEVVFRKNKTIKWTLHLRNPHLSFMFEFSFFLHNTIQFPRIPECKK